MKIRVFLFTGERIRLEHLLLGLAFVVELLHRVAGRNQHVAEFLKVSLGGERTMAGHDLGVVVRRLDSSDWQFRY